MKITSLYPKIKLKVTLDQNEGKKNEYASVICYSLFRKIEDVKKVDSVAV